MVATATLADICPSKRRLIDNWDLTPVRRRVMRDTGIAEADAFKLQAEYRKYLTCLLANPGIGVPVSKPVDEFWHTHMLFTSDYRRLQDEIFGGDIEHTPTLSDEEEEALMTDYQRITFGSLIRLYGSMDPNYWPERQMICLGRSPVMTAGCICTGKAN
jgi:hypothetical protein